MRLTKLYIHNYKSFYDTTIEFDKLNIVVGENNSGKSNLIDVLEFINIAMHKDIERAIDEKGGYERIKNYSAIGEEKIIVRTIFKIDNNYINNSVCLENISSNGFITLSISFTKKNSYFIIFVNSSNLKYIYSTKSLFKRETQNNSICHIYEKNSREKEKLYSHKLEGIINGIWLMALRSEIKSNILLSTYYFNTQKIKTLSNQDSKYTKLLKDGSNLGKVLYKIKEKNKNRFEAISNSLITTVNEIDGIEIFKVAGNYIIAFKERGEEPIPIHIVSDGTINFLATMTALNQDSNDFLLAFEEPERHLHFKVVNYLLESFRNSNKQIIITTHSTEMLKYANLNEVIFIYRNRDGDTKTIRADRVPNLKEKMEHMKYERCMTLDEMLDEDMVWDFEE